jgi:hypothetical protein
MPSTLAGALERVVVGSQPFLRELFGGSRGERGF